MLGTSECAKEMPVRQLFLENKFFALKEVCSPLLDDYSILVAVHYSFISSGNETTEILAQNNQLFLKSASTKLKKLFDLITRQGGIQTQNIVRDKVTGRIIPIGHSCTGRVIALGSKVKRFAIGDFVACIGEGFANHAEIVCVPEQLAVQVPKEELLKAASLMGVGALAMHSFRRANLALGETLCVMGVSTFGQLIIQIARASGCRVIAIDSVEKNLEYAKELGAEYVHLIGSSRLQETIDYLTHTNGVDCTLVTPECMHDDDINLAVSITRKNGRIMLTGNKSVTIRQERIQQKELEILFSLAYGPGRYDASYEYQGQDYPYAYVRWTENRNMRAFMHLIEADKIQARYFFEHEIALDEVSKVFHDIIQTNTLGILIVYEKKDEQTLLAPCKQEQKKTDAYIPARKDRSEKLNVTFFGANHATRLSLLPIMQNIKNAHVHKIIDRDITQALNAAKLYTGAIALAGDPELFYDDPMTDVVVVATCTQLHVEQVIKALKNGKALYLHKTLPLDPDVQKRLREYLHTNDTARVCFGYHRSAAPFIQKIKQTITRRKSPLMISYRLNLGGMDDADTLDTRPRHGNVIDKASHIFDLFYYLVESTPLAVSVEVVHPTRENIFSSDNFAAQISFSDGSVCTLQFTSLGHRDVGIERMEVHFDGKTIVMDDYVRLNGFGLPRAFDEIVRVPDKGREAYIRRFFNDVALQERSLMFDVNKFDVVSKLTMDVDHLVCQGGGELKEFGVQ